VEVINVREITKWNEIVQSMHEYDFYHLAEYHRLDTSGEAFLLYYATGNDAFAFPVIVRNIEGTGYKDITSVYGYAGPLSRTKNPAPEVIRLFQEELKKYFDTNRIISAFARLHPLFEDQASLLENRGEVSDTNLTVGIDLTLPESEQRKQFTHSLKQALTRAEKEKIIVRKAENDKEIEAFIDIYTENMQRIHANQAYFFSRDYFYNFLKSIRSFIEIAVLDGKVISGSLCTICNGIIQTHLAATKSEFLGLSPLKSVWNEVRLSGSQNQMQYLHFGGGVGGKNDTLFNFKAHFSKLRFTFKVWKYIHNPEVYNRLVQKKYRGNLPETTFFPLYRL
jgi:hypothetical protein